MKRIVKTGVFGIWFKCFFLLFQGQPRPLFKESRGQRRARWAGAIATIVALGAILGATLSGNALGQEAKPVIQVSDVATLQSIANDPNYANYRIELAPGTYLLTASLILQDGQEIIGAQEYVDSDGDGVWDPIGGTFPNESYAQPGTETVLDVRSMTRTPMPISIPNPDCDHPAPGSVFPSIALHGGNRLERVTIRGPGKTPQWSPGTGFLQVTAVPSGGQARVADCVLERSGFNALFVGISGCGSAGLFLSVVVERNVVRGNNHGIIVGTVSTRQTTIDAILRENRIYGNGVPTLVRGLEIIGGADSDDSTVRVLSEGNIIDSNLGGVVVIGGQPFIRNLGGNRNQVHWTSVDDRISRNRPQWGIVVLGGIRPAMGTSSDNKVSLQLLGTHFVEPGIPTGQQNGRPGGNRGDIFVAGAIGANVPLAAERNQVRLLLRRSDSDGAANSFMAANSWAPSAPSSNNEVIVIGSDRAFESANEEALPLLLVNLQAQALSGTEVLLIWDSVHFSANNLTFSVLRSNLIDGQRVLLGNVSAYADTFTDATAAPGTRYRYELSWDQT